MQKFLPCIILIMAAAVLSGCAATISKLDINARNAYSGPSSIEDTNAPTAYVRRIEDGRMFSKGTGYPGDPTPEIASATEREITIGRKRGGWGNAWGGYKLSEGKTVKTIIRTIFEDALSDSGYKVLHDISNITNKTLIFDLVITKFWLWIDMGWRGYAVQDTATAIIPSVGEHFTIDTQERRSVLGTDSTMMSVVHNGLTKYRIALTEKLRDIKYVNVHIQLKE